MNENGTELRMNGARDGFSLVEVVVSMVMLAAVLTSLCGLTTVTAQRSLTLANSAARQAFTLQETNRIASYPYSTLSTLAGCDTLATTTSSTLNQLKYRRCITVSDSTRYRLVTMTVTPLRAGTYADTVQVRRVTDVTANPLNQ